MEPRPIPVPPSNSRKHLAKRWWGRNGLTIKCTCGTYETSAGTTREQEDAHRAHRTAMGETVKPRTLTKVERLEAEIRRLNAENERLADVLNADDQPLLCPSCVCADCHGREGQHAPGGLCSCGCRPACDRFQRDSQLDLLRDAVTPLLGDHPLAEAVAHRTWHALNPTHAEEA